MNTRDKLQLMRESDRRNEEHERAFRREGERMQEKPRYTLTRAERETVINFDEEDWTAHIYTTSTVMQRRYDRLCAEDPESWKCVAVDPLGYFKKYVAPADRIAYRKTPSESRRAAGRKLAAKTNSTKDTDNAK